MLEQIVQRPPEQHSAIGKIVLGSDGRPVINATAVIAAVREQCKIETQYRAMFGVDLATGPGPVLDEQALINLAEIRVAQQYRAPASLPAPAPALPPDTEHSAPPNRQQPTSSAGRGQLAALPAPCVEVVQGEIMD